MSLSLSTLSETLPAGPVIPNTSCHCIRPTVTALPAKSIWRELPEAVFRRHVVELENATNAVPVDVQTFSLPSEDAVVAMLERHEGAGAHATQSQELQDRKCLDRQLNIATEQRLADDIAYLVAVGEGAQSVAAATIQEGCGLEGQRLKVTVASVDAIEPSSQSFLRTIFDILRDELSVESSQSLLDVVVRHHRIRLLNRLRSCKWKKPVYLSRTHKKPLHADFANLVHRAQFLYTKKEVTMRNQLEKRLLALEDLLQGFEVHAEADEHGKLVDIVRSSYNFCVSPLVADYLRRLQQVRATTQIQACLKTLRQVEKIAAHYRICLSLTSLSRAQARLFENVELLFLAPYEAVPLTPVAFHPWAKSTHVHAEVILIVHHDLESQQPDGSWQKPRCLGASKYFCYLCFLFIRHHGVYFPANTHGACYDQWTVPDLAEYPESVADHYRAVLQGMNDEIRNQTAGNTWRPEPMTSRENLIEMTKV